MWFTASLHDRKRILAVHSRRNFLTQTGVLAAGTLATPALQAGEITTDLCAPETLSLCGQSWFRADSANGGQQQRWYRTDSSGGALRHLRVPQPWQCVNALI